MNSIQSEIANLFNVMGDETRLRIIEVLLNKKMFVQEICDALEVTQSAVSHQLQILKLNKVVDFQKIGKQICYSLADHHIAVLYDIAKEHILEEKRV
jgi:ArsR family transcriptional regulator